MVFSMNVEHMMTFICMIDFLCARRLPLAAIVGDRIFCVHGGLSQRLNTLNDIDKLGRPLDINIDGLLSDLLWVDSGPFHNGFETSERGTSFTFGVDVVEEFLQNNDLDLLCRGHPVVHEQHQQHLTKSSISFFPHHPFSIKSQFFYGAYLCPFCILRCPFACGFVKSCAILLILPSQYNSFFENDDDRFKLFSILFQI
jgi:diadenosine tetraphosphatase ApaH/serine/threonine PP2A family protein phosphatase